jgi:prepilin-type N-terminal cleavage/methylation domain-containing protein
MGHLTNRKAFTLVELLVSIAIIATLTAILLPNFMGARERAKDAQKEQDMAAIKNALRFYYNDKGKYPDGDGITDVEDTLANDPKKYLGAATGVGYTYTMTDNGDGFLLKAYLDSGQGDDDINSQARCGVAGATDKLYVVCAK